MNPLERTTLNLLSAILILWICFIHSTTCEEKSTERAKGKDKHVTVYLNSKWNDTPIHLEAAEYLSEEHGDYFWSFMEALQQNADVYSSSSAKQQYELLMDTVKTVLDSKSKISLLKLSLSLRAYSPTVEMHNQLAIDRRNMFGIDEGTCSSFVELSSSSNVTTYACDIESLQKSLQTLRSGPTELFHPHIYKFDHIYPAAGHVPAATVILYGDICSQSFINLYKLLKEETAKGDLTLVVRYYVDTNGKEKASLSGYGVELAIKSTEYKAQDDARVKGEKTTVTQLLEEAEEVENEAVDGFDFKTLKDALPEKKKQLDEFRSFLVDRSKEIANFKVWELEELSLQAATRILSSPVEEQLELLRDISQNFPVVAKSLVNITPDRRIKSEVRINQGLFLHKLNLATSDSALFLNGMYFDLDSADVFTLLQYLKQEVRLIEGLHRVLGSDYSTIQELVKLDINDEKDEYQIDIRDSAIIYINDIENDKTYRSWPSTLQEMLRPTFPGMLRSIRRNIYHLVLIVDPAKKEAFDLIKLAESFYIHKAPLRIGFVFAVNPNSSASGYDDGGVACLNAFNYVSQDKSYYDGLSFLTDLIATVEGRDVQSKDVVSIFSSKYPKEDVDVVFGPDSAYDTGRVLAWEYLNRTGLGKPIKALLNGVVLKSTHLNGDLFEEAVLMEIMRATSVIQEAVHKQDLSDSMDVLDWLMSRKTVMPRLNDKILAAASTLKSDDFLDLSGKPSEEPLTAEKFESLPRDNALASFKENLRYLSGTQSNCLPITLWLAGNLEIPQSQKMLSAALEHLKSSSNYMRLALVHNNDGLFSKSIEASFKAFDTDISRFNFLLKLLKAADQPEFGEEKIFQIVPAEFLAVFKEEFNKGDEIKSVVDVHQAFIRKFLKLSAHEAAIVVNGRIIRITPEEPFIESDFALIEKHAMLAYGEKILSQLERTRKDDEKCSDILKAIGNVLMSHPQRKTRQDISSFQDQHSVIKIKPTNADEPAIDVVAVVEPLSRGAQKLAPLLLTLQKTINMDIKVYLNCIEKHSEMPLKNFFRFVLEPELSFSESGAIAKVRAHFAAMPSSPLLTLGVITLDNWLVGSVNADYDLDNIHLEEVEESGVVAVFELEYLLLEGHCFDQSTGNPPRGLQFILGTSSNPALMDTIVMANLGYFQLKANPGAWNLHLRPGRSEDIYSVVAHENTDSDESETSDVRVVISNFRSHVVKIRVNKKPGKETESLLYDSDEEEQENSIWGSLASWTGSKKKPENTTEDAEESNRLNIFSLASGHLYERLLRIMMLSVLKHTKSNVKFWFLKNYLSPGFKQFLPYMSQNYGFQYELVEYKWPRWLRQQTEKQRVIWGYKILFLDVLFPLNVKKIIFVDADQVVRTDLAQLRDLDLEGAPYGYTPFCDNRKEMDGYRFWKHGYWASHLRGRRYHISALYVVDLQKFRRIAAGDRLRGQYQDLSQDPNSLSNLDQDLPNNMIHQVNIKSLPQEWLWCETWCDDKSKKLAKTIDLCNNPKTKEPKLTAARRILPEWEAYDKEIATLMDEYSAQRRQIPSDEAKTRATQKETMHDVTEHTEL